MTFSELSKMVANHLVEGERGQQKALETFLQCSTDVEKALESLFLFELKQRRVSQDAMLKFVKSLPQAEWIIFACDQMLQAPDRWSTWAVAIVLRKCMALTTWKTLLLAEVCWSQRLSFTDRAIASSTPVRISSAIGGDTLYVAGQGYNHDKNNRSPFCWRNQWEYDNKKELWRLIPAPTGSSDFYIVSVYAEGYLCASNISVANDPDGYLQKKALVPCGNSPPDATGIWRLVTLEEDKYAFYNASQDTFLSCPPDAADGYRRGVITSTFHPLDEKRSKHREWEITAATMPLMETGIYDFFEKNYKKASVQTCQAIKSPQRIVRKFFTIN
ncbi:hypothetical protein GN958_ATG01173 [Phytophthora infestans]|uniref:Uncharacterized protein n=1 Tax=Phytophthora infestans TaxID=4787 RepID=A0A8S9V3C8_PHYIN|nr:hypothetical protein GN958_ATG02845 [Phytophthora infestans]KAF4149645.1 hypothetical protein GN958_ATG01173 [Phytophthora infestans]